jgi:hypothetical protein
LSVEQGAVVTAPIHIPGWEGESDETRYVQTAGFILVGLGFPAEIRTMMDAYRYLAERPASPMRNAAHSVAL